MVRRFGPDDVQRLVTLDDFYTATGLYVSMFSMTWVFEGLKPGDLDRQDFILF